MLNYNYIKEKIMAKPKDSVELRIFVTPELRNEIKGKAASRGMTITEYFLEMYQNQRQSV